MRLISMNVAAVITLLSLFGCCGHGVFTSKPRAGSTNSERLITLINGRRPSHPTNLGVGGQEEVAAGHVNIRRRTAKSVSESNLDTIVPGRHATHHATVPHNLIINRHHEGDIFATTGKKIIDLFLPIYWLRSITVRWRLFIRRTRIDENKVIYKYHFCSWSCLSEQRKAC